MSFHLLMGMNNHIGLVHEGKRAFKCNFCDASFKQKSYVARHILSFHDEKKEFKCEVCNAVFALGDNLKRHQRKLRFSQRKMLTCEICKKNLKSDLQRHIENVHNRKV